MIVLSGFLDHVGRLVHPDAQAAELDRARHRTFLITRFALFMVPVTAGLMALILGHVPAMWEAPVLAWLTVPFLAAVHVSRTGRLVEGEAACLVAWWGLAVTTTLIGGTSLLGGVVLLLVVPLEATFSGRRRLINAATLAAAAGVALLAAAQAVGVARVATSGMTAGDTTIAIPALLFVVVLARASFALQRHRQRLVALGEERYRVLSEAIGDLVLRYDRFGGVMTASREAKRLFGTRPRDLLGRGFFERVHVADRPAFLKLFADAADSGENVSARLRLRTSRVEEGQGAPEAYVRPVFAWIEIRARRSEAPVAGTRGRRPVPGGTAIVAIVRDITGQVEHEQAIQSAKLEAERVSLWKDGFLANVSHELRTPLNAIIGFSEMLASAELSPRDPDKQREYARIITTSGQHLLAVVNSLLDISKIEAGRFELQPESFDVAAMIQSCCDMVGLKAAQQTITVRRDLAATLDEIVCDKRACKQIVINLLSNALKFTPTGGEVTIAARPDGDAVLLTVADTGVGIAARDLQHLGSAFFQAKAGLDRDYEGTGLGLSVVRGLVGLHGGTIAIASAPGEGTQVTVRLPADCRIAEKASASAKIETISRYRRPQGPVSQAAVAKVIKVA